jgi:general secretion pathway protein D
MHHPQARTLGTPGTAERCRHLWICWFALLLCVTTPAIAQRTTTTGGRNQGVNRTAGGGNRAVGGTGAGGTRQYYGPSDVGEAIVTSDPETRRIIVITDDETSQYISQVITNLDRPKPQVLIKVVFLEVTHRDASDIGFEYGGKHDAGGSASGVGSQVFGLAGLGNAATGQILNSFGIPLTAFAPIPPGAGIYQLMSSDFRATLRAIAQAGKTKILSRPSILTRNSQQATISLGQEVPLITNTRFDAVNGQINTVTYQSVGIILRVTPFITDDQKVEMIVAPETSELADRSTWVPIGGGVLAPVINSRVADTVVVVPNAQTAVIGGLMSKAGSQTDSKIPILGDIPLLGNLFKRRIKDDVRTELIIFLTPYIVRDGHELAGMTAAEQEKTYLQRKSLSEEELNQFLDGIPVKGHPEGHPEPPPNKK